MDAGTLIFDLDGTLWDTNAACALAWNRVVAELGVPFRELTEHDIRRVCGRSHREAVGIVFQGFDEALIDRICERTMEEDNRLIAQLGGQLFEGVEEGIRVLAARLPLMIVSNCQSGYIEVFRATSGLAACFVDHECWGNTGRSKGENLRAIIARNSAERPVFVGDTDGDQTAAEENAVPFIHAAYGFGKVQGADAVLDRFSDLLALVQRV
jgi:phosphoglycolate phosphatase